MNPLKVGLLTLAALASIVVMSLKITSNKSGFGDYVTYKTVLKDASGIFEKSSIKVAGINAGRIKTIELNGADGALVTFEMLEGIKITNNTRLKIKSVGLLGDKYLDIILGDQNADKLAPESMVPAEGGEGFEELSKDAGAVLKEVKEIAKTIKESLRDEQGRNMMKEIIANIHDITGSLKRLSTGNEDKINTIIDEVNVLSSVTGAKVNHSSGTIYNELL